MDKNNQYYQIPQQELDKTFAEIVRQNPELEQIGREIEASYDRSAVGAAVVDTSRLEFSPAQKPEKHPSIAEIAAIGIHLANLRSNRLGESSDRLSEV